MKNVLIIATDGFEQSELMGPKARLEDAGLRTTVASLEGGDIRGWNEGDWGESVTVDMLVKDVDASEYDALMLPGGQMNPDILRMDETVIGLVKQFDTAKKPIAAICHAPWLLAEADVIKGRIVTGWPSIRTDLKNAGGEVIDSEAAVDGNLITSRNPDDIPAFSKALIDAVGASARVSENA